MLNKCILIGRLTGSPELRYTNDGTPVSNFNIAVERPFTNSNGERDSDYIDVVAWRKLAETSAEYLSKGRLVAVTGRLQIRENESEQGRNYINPEIVANVIKFLDSPDGSNGNNNNNSQNSSDSVDGKTHTKENCSNGDSIPDNFNNDMDQAGSENMGDIQVPF